MGTGSLARKPATGSGLAMMAAFIWRLILPVALLLRWPAQTLAMRPDRLAELRKETAAMFYHGYNNYMQHAFPEDEVRNWRDYLYCSRALS